ncbi:hypothetical protein PRNP1_004029 [Phytophthora ramorum]
MHRPRVTALLAHCGKAQSFFSRLASCDVAASDRGESEMCMERPACSSWSMVSAESASEIRGSRRERSSHCVRSTTSAGRLRPRTSLSMRASMELLRSKRFLRKSSITGDGPRSGRLPGSVSMSLLHDCVRMYGKGSMAGRQLLSALRDGGTSGDVEEVDPGGFVSDGHESARMYWTGWHRSAMDMAWCVSWCCRLSGGMGDAQLSEKLPDLWMKLPALP